MQIGHQFEVKAPIEKAFASLRDIRVLAACLPGCRDLKELGPDQYAAVIEIQVAFLKMKFDVNVQITEAAAPTDLKAKVVGKPFALAGQLTMAAGLTLESLAADRTSLAYSIDLSITGKLGSVGQSAFRAKAEEMGEKFAEKLKAALEGESAGVVA